MALKIRAIAIVLLTVVLLLSCQSADQSSGQGLKPGDKIGDMVLMNLPEKESRAKDIDQPMIHDYCELNITPSDPVVVVKTCELPWKTHLFCLGGPALKSPAQAFASLCLIAPSPFP